MIKIETHPQKNLEFGFQLLVYWLLVKISIHIRIDIQCGHQPQTWDNSFSHFGLKFYHHAFLLDELIWKLNLIDTFDTNQFFISFGERNCCFPIMGSGHYDIGTVDCF